MTVSPVEIKFRDVRLVWPSRTGDPTVALDNLNCVFPARKVSAIIGPSGCGKSTMLQLIRGFLGPSEGEIRFVDQRNRHSVAPPVMSTVWQNFNLFPWLTVVDNVIFGLEIARMPKAERELLARKTLASVDLSGFEKKFPRQLSGGMRQRVGIARALVMQPEILLLDEPFGALDAQTRLVLQDQVAQIVHATSATAILVTHSIEEAILLGDHIFVMTARPGRIATEIAVDLPRPRTLSNMQEPAFANLFDQIYRLLKDEVVRAMVTDHGSH